MSYEELLKKAYQNLPDTQQLKGRFEIPKVRGHLEGNKTVVSNFFQIAQAFNRKPEHLLKYLTKELATPAAAKKSYIVFGTKIPASRINERIEKYAEDYVLCRECGKPDTKLMKEDKYVFLRCMACGSRRAVNA
jgi:translation initiation factor 2 subunit 2